MRILWFLLEEVNLIQNLFKTITHVDECIFSFISQFHPTMFSFIFNNAQTCTPKHLHGKRPLS